MSPTGRKARAELGPDWFEIQPNAGVFLNTDGPVKTFIIVNDGPGIVEYMQDGCYENEHKQILKGERKQITGRRVALIVTPDQESASGKYSVM